jgi:hypothetical protein
MRLLCAALLLTVMTIPAGAQRECGGGPCGIGDNGRLHRIPTPQQKQQLLRQACKQYPREPACLGRPR